MQVDESDALRSLVTEPIRDGCPGPEAFAQLSSRDVKSLHAGRDLVDRLILVGGRKVGHLLEWNHLDLEFILELLDKFLGIIRAIKILSMRILSRASMVSTDNKVSCTKVFANDGMPDCFAGSSHPHSKR